VLIPNIAGVVVYKIANEQLLCCDLVILMDLVAHTLFRTSKYRDIMIKKSISSLFLLYGNFNLAPFSNR
jgi:hypothetical protein